MKNKEGLWKFSPSGLYTYEECPACFWIEQNIGRFPSIPMRLNSAVDEKLKNRFDKFRKAKRLPPELEELKDIKLFEDTEILNAWRERLGVLRYINEKDGYVLDGKLDDVLVNEHGEHIPIDFKSSGDPPREDKQKYYRSQLHAYALMLREKGYKPAGVAYLIHYFTKDRQDPSLTMEFSSHLDKVIINLESFEKKLKEMADFLDKKYPGDNPDCDKCFWAEKRKGI